MPEPSDGQLYKSACEGDDVALRQIVERHSRLVIRVAGAKLDHATSLDVAQITWFKFFEHVRGVRNGGSPLDQPEAIRGWLATTALREAVDEHRRRQRRPTREVFDEDAVYQPDFDERLTWEQRRRAVWAAAQRLSEKCRELLSLLTLDPPLEYREIASMLGRPVGSIGPTRQRCLDDLRAAL